MGYHSIDLSEWPSQAISILAGVNDANLLMLSQHFGPVILRNQQLLVQNQAIEPLIEACLTQISHHQSLNASELAYLIRLAKSRQLNQFKATQLDQVVKTATGRWIKAKTLGQAKLVEAFHQATIIFASGPAGTGKTFLSIAYAVSQLKSGKVDKIILTRPAVEAGESLGFLPGDMKEKVDPYLRPLYDALNECLTSEKVEKLIEKGIIEIAPLAFMRGRTLSNACVILDEAQNATFAQLKLFITRLGQQSQMMINGDPTQIDLWGQQPSGLHQTMKLLEGIDDIACVHLSAQDVVRHPLVSAILDRYAEFEKK